MRYGPDVLRGALRAAASPQTRIQTNQRMAHRKLNRRQDAELLLASNSANVIGLAMIAFAVETTIVASVRAQNQRSATRIMSPGQTFVVWSAEISSSSSEPFRRT